MQTQTEAKRTRNVYMVRVSGMIGTTRNKRIALKCAGATGEVYAMPVWFYSQGVYPYGWDTRTFISQSDRIK